MQPKWDVTLGRRMYLDGKSDKEIAEHFGIAVSTVSYQRRRSWEESADAPPCKRSGAYLRSGEIEVGSTKGRRSRTSDAAV